MQTKTTTFGQFVRDRLIANKVTGTKPDSIRSLARKMGNDDPVRSETFKRSLLKWMNPGGPSPSRTSRALVAQGLGIDEDELPSDDDEEEDPVAALMQALRRVVRDEVRTIA